ncbi:efflux transporter outer membrane subunit [Sterolibacterium denitrificans]|nr:efflux transporter outer membrane subunit [Sterolibacterium denitrificans]
MGCRWSVLAGLLLSGCAALPGNGGEHPDAAELRGQVVPSRYIAQALGLEGDADDELLAGKQQVVVGAALEDAWWSVFGSADIDALVRRALARNRSLNAARHTLAQAEELVTAERGLHAPEVDLAAGAGRERYGAQALGGTPPRPPFGYVSVGPRVRYALDLGGGVDHAVERQLAFAERERQQLRAAALAVSGNTVTRLLRSAALRDEIALVEGLIELDREEIALANAGLAAGGLTRLDVAAAEGMLAADAARLPDLRQELALDLDALAVLLGEAPADAALPDIGLAQLTLPRRLPLSLPSELAQRRPDIRAAEAELREALAAVGIARANLYPRITLSAGYGQQAASPGKLFSAGASAWSLAGELVAPLFDGGRRRAQHQASAMGLRASAARYQQTVLAAFGQVADALQSLDYGTQRLAALDAACAASSEQLELMRRSQREGQASRRQVLAAERNQRLARLAQQRALGQRYLDSAQVMLALGGGDGDALAVTADGLSGH